MGLKGSLACHLQGSVWGSGLAGAACAAAALATGAQEPWRIGFVASFVSKLSDTVSSEIGKVGEHAVRHHVAAAERCVIVHCRVCRGGTSCILKSSLAK